MRISDWSSDVCSSDLAETRRERLRLPSTFNALQRRARLLRPGEHLGEPGQRREEFRQAAALKDVAESGGQHIGCGADVAAAGDQRERLREAATRQRPDPATVNLESERASWQERGRQEGR